MKTRAFTFLLLATALLSCLSAQAQQAQSQPQPLIFWYDYTVNPGKEDDFLNLVKTVGAPVRDKLMADGVVLAWGVMVPMLRQPSGGTHMIWYAVQDWSGVEKVDSSMRAQIAKLTAEGSKAAETAKKGQKSSASPMDRLRELVDYNKTRDYLTRDLVSRLMDPYPTGVLPHTRFAFTKVKPGKGGDYRRAWEKYNKPVLDKLVGDGVILGYGFSVEELRVSGEFTHFTWIDVKELAAFDKLRDAFAADRARRSPEERDAIGDLFSSLTDADAARSEVWRSIIFRVPGQK
jgi:hypothetical protein